MKRKKLLKLYIYITTSNISHTWNMIRLDGKWYHIDVTWMDSENNFYKYFMMSDSICYSTDHSKWEYYWNQKTSLRFHQLLIPKISIFTLTLKNKI